MRLGTTVATNAILERKGATVAYVTTKGFRDIIFVQRGNRKYHYNMSWVKPKPLAKGRDCFDVDERVDAYVNIIKALDENEVRRSTGGSRQCPRSRRSRSACSSPISTPAHELRIKEILAEMLPGKAIFISYDVLPK
jgi:N-methylhydantoinase A